ncbi:MAG: glycosyltransferase family 2 protein, partial [Lachnospiraceae bacterium]|nr:glycosyltransferase family 2 protein [Lachnospiraceae bacterium]
MKVGIVILNYNSYGLTQKLVEHIRNFENISNIIIVDNCSTNNSCEVLQKICFGNVELIKTAFNGGYASGNNVGCRYLIDNYNPEIIIISNPDVLFDEDYVLNVCQAFEENPNYAAFTGLMCFPDGRQDSRQYLLLPNYWEDLMNCFAVGRIIVDNYLDKKIHVDYQKKINIVKALPGSLFAVRTSSFLDIGMFDENTFLYYEENILGKKFENSGIKMGLLTNCKYLHNHAATIGNYV